MKKKITIILTIIFTLSLVACGKNIESNQVYAFPEPPTEINVTYYGGGTVVTYSLEEFNSIMNWFYKLKLTEMNGEPEIAEGNQLFEIIVDGKEAFSYDNRGSEAYLYVNDKIYQVKNPTNPPYNESRHIFKAMVIEISDNYFLVEPLESMWELYSAGRFQVPMKNMDASPEPEIGDTLEIIYNGEFQETYPAIITEVYSIKVIEKAVEETPNNTIKGENCVAVIGKGTLSQAVELSVEDTDFLLKVVENIEWIEDSPKCEQDCTITLSGNLYYYHSSCGTLEKIDLSEVSTQSSKEPKNSSMYVLDRETKDLVNSILKKYIELEK